MPTSSPNRNTRGSASIACPSPWRIASAYESSRTSASSAATTSFGINISRQLCRIRIGTRFREFERLLDLPLRALLERRQVAGLEAPAFDELRLQAAYRVALAPRLDLVLGPVEIAVALGMPAQPVGLA